MNNNLILIGMPGAGKSSAGVIAAKALGMSFLDTDLLIQEQTGKRLSELIAERGVDGFLKLENDILKTIAVSNTIVATGGSAVFGEDAMRNLKNIGTIVYLRVEYDALKLRLGDLDERGVIRRDGETLDDIFRTRAALYETYADATIAEKGIGFSLEQTVSDIIALKNRNDRT